MLKILKSFQVDKKYVKMDGTVRAVIATMGLVDKDGDVTLPGFFGKQEAVVVPVHDWSHVPIGKAYVHEEGNEAIADIQMNMDIQSAKEWHSAMMFDMANGTPLMEWSYGFKVLEGGSNDGELEGGRRVRFLKPIMDGTPGSKIIEVSPVMLGAGENTRTLLAKDAQGSGKKFVEELDSVLASVDELLKRAKSLADLRMKDGRDMSQANKEKIASLSGSLLRASEDAALLCKTEKDPQVLREYLRFVKNGPTKGGGK